MATNHPVPPELTAEVLAELRARLEAERARLRTTLVGLRAEDYAANPSDPLTADPSDFSEMGADITSEDTTKALTANDERLLAQIEHALQRMDQGLYGLSEVSGLPIPVERLQALPWATTTIGEKVQH